MDGSVSSWLSAIHLQEYVPILNRLGYDTLDKCASIKSKDALRGMGVTKVGHLNRLYRAVEKLRGEDSSSNTLPPNATITDYDATTKSKSLTLLPCKYLSFVLLMHVCTVSLTSVPVCLQPVI